MASHVYKVADGMWAAGIRSKPKSNRLEHLAKNAPLICPNDKTALKRTGAIYKCPACSQEYGVSS